MRLTVSGIDEGMHAHRILLAVVTLPLLAIAQRTVIVDEDMLHIRARPSEGAPANAALEAGVIARLGECEIDWCRISAGGYRGWAPKTALWGVDADEIRE